jgi:hypothetical protein
MTQRKKAEVEAEPESIPPVSGPRRRSTQPLFAPASVSSAPRRQTQPGLSAPPPQPVAGERVLRAAGLTPRPVRAPR